MGSIVSIVGLRSGTCGSFVFNAILAGTWRRNCLLSHLSWQRVILPGEGYSSLKLKAAWGFHISLEEEGGGGRGRAGIFWLWMLQGSCLFFCFLSVLLYVLGAQCLHACLGRGAGGTTGGSFLLKGDGIVNKAWCKIKSLPSKGDLPVSAEPPTFGNN